MFVSPVTASDTKIRLLPGHAGQRHVYRNRSKRIVIRCGRRWGKTTMFENWASNWAVHGKQVGFFAPQNKLLSPSYTRILNTLRPAVKSSNRGAGLIELTTGGSVEFWSFHNNTDVGRSRKYDEVIIDEASLVPDLKEIFEQSIAPTLLDFNGNATMGGTPKGIDEESYFYQACTNDDLPEQWQEFYAPTSKNPMLNAAAVAALKAKNNPLVWAQEYNAEFVSWAGEALLSLDKLLINGKGVPYPLICDGVYAVVDSAMKDGSENDGTAVVYFAKSQYSGIPLVVLDWEVRQITSDLLVNWLPSVFNRLTELSAQCHARGGSAGVWIEDKASGITLLQHGERVGWPVHPIEGDLTAQGKDARAVLASGPVFREEVKLSEFAYNKMMPYKGVTKNHLVSQVCSYVLCDKDAAKRADDLTDATTYGIIIGLGGPDGF
jgi:hypothetical protein